MSKQLFDEENEQHDKHDTSLSAANNELYAQLDNIDDGRFQFFGKFEVDNAWVQKNKVDSYNSHESYELAELDENLYTIFKDSYFVSKYEGNKKVPKHEMVKIYLYFLKRINNHERYTAIEKFIAIVSFMKMNFEIMYRELPIIHKEAILKEFNDKYHMISNKKAHKLF